MDHMQIVYSWIRYRLETIYMTCKLSTWTDM
jgi:hypothetical protein